MKSHYHLQEYNQIRLASYVVLLYEEPLASPTRALPYMVLHYEEPLPPPRLQSKTAGLLSGLRL